MIYTVSKYRPAWPDKGQDAYSVLRGTVESNRDALSPSLIWVVEVSAPTAYDARRMARQQHGEE